MTQSRNKLSFRPYALKQPVEKVGHVLKVCVGIVAMWVHHCRGRVNSHHKGLLGHGLTTPSDYGHRKGNS